ncbi:MAG TPA: branched-chain amino acid ABC transporter permease, partial [Myxococcaceae bacterium]|nr:branched-chain amino acid ABC transporter permease [Myxococcaceae bacterium]
PARASSNMILFDRTAKAAVAAAAVLLAGGFFLPQWALFLTTLSLAKGLVVLGLLLLMRTGLVSFGQGLYYCLGAYAAGTLGQFLHVSDALLMLLLSVVICCAVASVLGVLLAAYRGIFFAMLSLAFSMILYGLLVKSSALGSTDGFNVAASTLAGASLAGRARFIYFAISVLSALIAAIGMHGFLSSDLGRLAPAVRDNELRVEYLGASVRRVVYLNTLIAAALAGLGGGLTALVVGHIDPDLAYWTSSGEFVFVAILSGTANVLAPFLGSVLFEVLRSFAYEYSPNTWQMVVGVAMLLVIAVLPRGLWSVFSWRRKVV